MIRSWRDVALAVTAIASMAVATSASSSPESDSAAPDAASVTPAIKALEVVGAVADPLNLSRRELRESYPAHRVTVEYESSTGPETHTYRGALLLDVLTSAAPTFDPDVKNDKLRYAVRASASFDDYAAVVSWGELDVDFQANEILVAYREDGSPLGRGDLRLVVPGDARGGRYVSGLDTVSLQKLGG